ncbi:MAG: hypothetical protein PUE54_01685, partial [Bacteroidales bacterium]|nr:hypothetical protein [Bacteroidales bacterium]
CDESSCRQPRALLEGVCTTPCVLWLMANPLPEVCVLGHLTQHPTKYYLIIALVAFCYHL